MNFSEYTALRLLREDRLLGLDLLRRSEGALKRGTIYFTLSRLEDKGLIGSTIYRDAAHDNEHRGGHARRLYWITAKGLAVLELNAPPRRPSTAENVVNVLLLFAPGLAVVLTLAFRGFGWLWWMGSGS